MPFEFWLLLVLALVPIFIGIYDLHAKRHRAAVRSILVGTLFSLGVLIWIFFFHQPEVPHPDPDPPVSDVNIVTVSDQPWTNDWPNMGRDPNEVSSDDSRFRNVNLWVEGIVFTAGHTILHVKLKNRDEITAALLGPASGTYIIDDQGTSYYVQSEGRLEYEPFRSRGEIRAGVTERFELTFPAIPHTGYIKLKYPEFPSMTIYKIKPAPTPVTVSFCRSAVWNSWFDMDLLCDRKHVAYLPGQKATDVLLLSGKHGCSIEYKSTIKHTSESLQLDIVAGKQYFVQIGQNQLTSQLTLKEVPTAQKCME